MSSSQKLLKLHKSKTLKPNPSSGPDARLSFCCGGTQSTLCSSSVANDRRSTTSDSKRNRNGQDVLEKSLTSVPSAQNRRCSYSHGRKFASSLPSSKTTLRGTEFLRQVSLGDIAMQNNCTVINNKVAPVVIKNCKEEYQVRQSSTWTMGRLHDMSAEHELLVEKFFLLKDNFVGIDRHDTLEDHGVPNMRMSDSKPTIYAIGQPTMSGLKRFSTSLLSKHNMVYYINIRAVPTLFLRRSGDFLPYSAYCKSRSEPKIYLTQRQLHDAEREMQLQALEIASANADRFYYYNVLDTTPDEPHMYATSGVEDLVTSRQMYAKIQSEHLNFKYKRLVLPGLSDPTSDWVDSIIDVLKDGNFFRDKNCAIVFQGLTGEGPAYLAMILTSLALHNSETPRRQTGLLSRIESMQRSATWREFIIHRLMTASRLDVDNLRHAVDSAITRTCNSVIFEQVALETIRVGETINSDLELGIKDIRTNESPKAMVKSCSKALAMASDKNRDNALTLRDVSEMSLPSPRRSNEHGSAPFRHSVSPPCAFCISRHTLIRYEVCDEECTLRKLLLSPTPYYFLVIFRAYLEDQVPLGLQRPFSRWLLQRPNLIFDLTQTSDFNNAFMESGWELVCKTVDLEGLYYVEKDPTFHRVTGLPIYGIAQSLPENFSKVVVRLCGANARTRYKQVIFINVREEMVFYSADNECIPETNEESDENSFKDMMMPLFCNTQWELHKDSTLRMHGSTSDILEEIEIQLKDMLNRNPECVRFTGKKPNSLKQGFLQTTKDVIEQLNCREEVYSVCDSVMYLRLPLPRYRIPNFKCFDQLVQMVKDSNEKETKTACVFFCHNGKRRTTHMMAAACLVYGHMKGFPESFQSSLSHYSEPWVPDEGYTRGEFKVVLELLQMLPDCQLRKQEVDSVLDLCHEDMSTMHYHLREHLNPTYKKARRARSLKEFLKCRHRSLQSLEFYVFLILFNCYLNQEKSDLWHSLSFEGWMCEYASRLGVMDLLNNFGFMAFGEDYPMNLMDSRWMSTTTLLRSLLCETQINQPGEISRTSNTWDDFSETSSRNS